MLGLPSWSIDIAVAAFAESGRDPPASRCCRSGAGNGDRVIGQFPLIAAMVPGGTLRK
jgi:hypothetical protein